MILEHPASRTAGLARVGDLTGACTPPSECSPPPKPKPLTTLQPLPSNRSRSQYENGTEPVTVHRRWVRRGCPGDPGAIHAFVEGVAGTDVPAPDDLTGEAEA